MTISNEKLRRENGDLKAGLDTFKKENNRLKTEVDQLKNEVTQLKANNQVSF